jgi:hypothetical protein
MSGGWRRRLADRIGRSIADLLPAHMSSWARAMRNEIAAVESDREALGFALGCLRAASLHALLFHLAFPFAVLRAAVRRLSSSNGGDADMKYADIFTQPRMAGPACAIAATGLGLAYMSAADAPARYLAVNGAALVLGLAAFAAIGRPAAARLPGWAMLALGGVLLGTSLFGISAEGAARWIRVGPLVLQVSLILLPLMLISFAQRRNAAAAAGIALAATALAIQPDRAMAGALAAGLAALAALRPDRWALAALLAALAAFAAALLQPDSLPAAPFVDRVFRSAFALGLPAGLAVVAGACLLPVPSLLGWLRDPGGREAHAVFGALWLAILAAAALGNYPTPLVGYGGSAVLGYLLALAFLPRAPSASACADGAEERLGVEGEDGPGLRLAAG